MNEWFGWIIGWMCEWMVLISGCMSEWMNVAYKWIHERMNDWMGWISGWIIEWKGWISGWMSDWFHLTNTWEEVDFSLHIAESNIYGCEHICGGSMSNDFGVTVILGFIVVL